MTEQEIRDGAPPTATHYGLSGKYYKHNGIHWVVWKDDYKSWMGVFVIGKLKPLP